MNTTNSTGSNREFALGDPSDPTINTETRECDRCGEEYEEIALLSDGDAGLCLDCREPWTGADLGSVSSVGVADSRPFMEFGPLSHERHR